MGFAAIDRQFRRKEIIPECADCANTGKTVQTRYRGEDDEALLCIICYCEREIAKGPTF